LISLGCGFAANSIIPEMRRVRVRPGAARIFASRPVRIALLIANRLGLRRSNRKGCDLGALLGLDCSFDTSFAIRLGSVLGFAGVV
jgi:hypothetical protein